MKLQLTIFGVLCSTALLGQDFSEFSSEGQERITKTSLQSEFIPSIRQTVLTPNSSLEVSTATNEGDNNIAGTVAWSGFNSTISASASAPLSNSGSNPLTLDGLSSGSSLSLTWQRKWFVKTELKNPEWQNFMNSVAGNYGGAAPVARSGLNATDKAAYDKADLFMWTDLIMGATCKWAKEDFTFSKDSSLATIDEETKSRFSFGGYIALTPKVHTGNASFFKLSANYEVGFEGGSSETYLLPSSGSSSFTERELFIGSPTKSEEWVIEAMFAKRFKTKLPLGINPSVMYKVNSEEIGTNINFFGFKDPTKGLNGGFFVSWQSKANELSFETENFGAGLFLGINFKDLFKL